VRLLAVGLVSLLPAQAIAGPYYVATNGSDAATGASWAQALKTISNAVAKATAPGDVIWVSNGTHSITAPIVVRYAVTLRSLNGRQATRIRRQGPAQHRILECTNGSATIQGFTLLNGNSGNASGGGVYLTGGRIQDCSIISNVTVVGANAYGGGGMYVAGPAPCIVSNCTIAQCTSDRYAGGIYLTAANAVVTRCIVSNNVNWIWGGGIYMTGGLVRDSIITRNTLTGNNGTYGGGGIWMNAGRVVNCTVAKNTLYDSTPGAGILKSGGTVSNSIIFHNLKGTLANDISTASGVARSCAPELTSGTGNITADPDFADAAAYDFRLLPTSPCIDKGTNTAAGAVDLPGNTRVTDGDGNGTATADMGALETDARNAGPLRCAFTGTPLNGLVPFPVVLTAAIAGADTNGAVYCWDFENDGVTNRIGAAAWKTTNTYASAGLYSVRLVLTNGIGTRASFTRAQYIRAAPTVVYVATNGGHLSPYDTWQKAATNIDAALAFQVNGLTVTVSSGTHRAKNVLLNFGTTVKSAGGSPQTTVFRMPGGTGRLFEMTHSNAVLDGLTIRGGNSDFSGGGVYMLAGTVRNCIIESNQAPQSVRGGGGICVEGPARVLNCVFRKNYGMHYSGGLFLNHAQAVVEQCIFSNNSVYVWGGGIYMTGGTVRNSLICRNWLTMNHTSYGGGGVWMSGGRLDNCTIVENTVGDVTPGGGVLKSGGTITNCIVYYNLKGLEANDLPSFSGVQYSCAPELTSGTGNTKTIPEFADRASKDYRLWPFSPCVDSGINLGTVTNDLSGNPRPKDGNADSVATHDMGALEAPLRTENPFRCNFLASTFEGQVPLSVVFTSTVAGPVTNGTVYRWDFNNNGVFENPPGVTGSTVVSYTFTSPGLYSVRLLASNAVAGTCTRVKAGYILAFATNVFVSTVGSHTAPYTNWATAATNLASALTYAANGVTVWVSNGTYATTPLVITKAIALRSVQGPRFTRIIKGSGNGTLLDAIAAGTTIEGFTISGGNAAAGYNGGGIRLFNGGNVRNCVLTNNHADANGYGGGAIYIGGPGVIEDCTIAGNTGFHYSGGIYAAHAQARVDRCSLSNNSAFVWGGGVYVDGGATVRNTLVCKNYLTGNHSSYGGGGVRLVSGKMENCTVAENWVGAATPGGGIRKDGGTITNSIIYFNLKGTGADNLSAISGVAWSCAPELVSGQGNMTADPKFRATNRQDYVLLGNSPCINAGTNQAWIAAGILDLAGRPRKARGVVDMGAYEFQPITGCVMMFR